MRRGEFISLLGGTVAVWPLLVRIKWRYATPIIFVHLVALLACVPWFFSWTGVVLAVLGAYVFGLLGMNIGYHRLLTHRSFSCPRWMERSLAVVGACCLEESPAVWVALHRQHHSAADKEEDPHSPVSLGPHRLADSQKRQCRTRAINRPLRPRSDARPIPCLAGNPRQLDQGCAAVMGGLFRDGVCDCDPRRQHSA